MRVFLKALETKAFPGPELVRIEKWMEKRMRLMSRGIPNM